MDTLDILVLDLDDRYRITSIKYTESADKKYSETSFTHQNGKIKIDLPVTKFPNDLLTVKIYYGGKPRVAERPPWD